MTNMTEKSCRQSLCKREYGLPARPPRAESSYSMLYISMY
jgi:hypothetical protein